MSLGATTLRSGLLLAAVVVAPVADATIRAHVSCADLEPRPARTSSHCYVGVPCLIGVTGPQLDATDVVRAVSEGGGVSLRAELLSKGRAGVGVARCGPVRAGSGEGTAVVRIDAPLQAGAYALVLERPRLLGIARDEDRIAFQVLQSHGYLDPRQVAASEFARQGEAKSFTFTGRQLGALRVRSDARALRAADGRPDGPAPDVQWLAPDQSAVRIRLTLHVAGPVSTRDLFEFLGSGESPVNRDLGWPVIEVRIVP